MFRKKHKKPVINQQEKTEEPVFYCNLCSRFQTYSDLIDGYKCCHCDNEFFLVPWKEFKHPLQLKATSNGKTRQPSTLV